MVFRRNDDSRIPRTKADRKTAVASQIRSGTPVGVLTSDDSGEPAARRSVGARQVLAVSRGLALLAFSVLVGCSGSDSSSPTAPATPPLVVSTAPASAEVEIDGTVVFRLQVSGGASGSTASWTCASSDTEVATASVTSAGCSATGIAAGSVTITAAIMKGAQTSNATASLEVLPPPSPPLVVSMSPTSAEVEIGGTVPFTIHVSGGGPSSTATWTCASSNTGIASASATASGCSATGVTAGSVTLTAAITKAGEVSQAEASLEVKAPTATGARDRFAYWDANGNGDLTCTEARGKDEGLRLPAYRDDRDGTGVIYEWLERGTSSDADGDGTACESTPNPDGYVPATGPAPPAASEGKCPAGSPTWMGLPVCEEGARTGYDRDSFGSAYSSLEDEIIESLPKSGTQVYTPYTCRLFDVRADGTAATDIEHIVALAEAYDSGLAEPQFRTFAGDIDNLTIADPTVNRDQKSDRDAGEWGPPRNRGWFAARVVAVKQKYALSLDPAERDALQTMLDSDLSRHVTC